VRSFETSRTASPVTQLHNPEERNPQTHSYEIEPAMFRFSSSVCHRAALLFTARLPSLNFIPAHSRNSQAVLDTQCC